MVMATGGCALTQKSPPITPRFFTPEGEKTAFSGPRYPRLALRLHHVSAGAHLKRKIVYRDSSHELGFYERLRWAELPEKYLRRALSTVLFEERGVRQVITGSAPTLEVELTSFDELRGDKPGVRVAATVMLHKGGMMRLRQSIVVQHPMEDDAEDEPQKFAETIGVALRELAERLAAVVITELDKQKVERKPPR